MTKIYYTSAFLLLLLSITASKAVSIKAGVASSLAFLHQDLVDASALDIRTQTGATGILFAQLSNGLPLNFLLAANDKHPQHYLQHNPHQVCGNFKLAQGKLALIGAQNLSNIDWENMDAIIIANPKLAPYGEAAQQWLNKVGFRGKTIFANNALSVLHLHQSGMVKYAITAHALAARQTKLFTPIPHNLHNPIIHSALWLKRNNHCSKQSQLFWDFLQSEQAKDLIKKHHFIAP